MPVSFIVLNLAYLVLVLSTLSRTIVVLRSVLVGAAALFVLYGLLAEIPSIAVWNSITGSLHAVALARYGRERLRAAVTPEEEEIRRDLFDNLDPVEFRALWKLGHEVLVHNELLIECGTRQQHLMLILSGTVDVRRESKKIVRLERGALIGEVSRFDGNTASADCVAVGFVWARRWEFSVLDDLATSLPNAARAMALLTQRNLATKLRVTTVG